MHNFRSVLFGLLVAQGPILVLAHGLIGITSAVSAVFMIGVVAGLIATARSTDNLRFEFADAAFLLFVAAVAVSTWQNGATSSAKEYALFGLTLACYPAGRLFSAPSPPKTFPWLLAAILLVGSAATLIALIEQFHYPHGKPLVFGEYDAAPAQFLMLAGFIIFAVLTIPVSGRERNCLFAICAVCAVLFAASQVRFTFVAFGLVMLLAVKGRWRYGVAASLVGIVAVGLLLRPAMSLEFIGHIFTPAGCSAEVSSISMRKQLFSEAISLIPSAGPFGLGFEGFLAKTCVGVEVHNSFLQAAVEFGWIGGLAFAGVILAGVRASAPFALYGFMFELVLSTMHGRLSSDFLLLFFAGYAVRSRSVLQKHFHAPFWRIAVAPVPAPVQGDDAAVPS